MKSINQSVCFNYVCVYCEGFGLIKCKISKCVFKKYSINVCICVSLEVIVNSEMDLKQ